ncbi:MAG: hypothetical protein AB3N64_01025 [Puniceicoccaceae bacterium]
MTTLSQSATLPVPYDLSAAPEWFLKKARFAKRFFLNLAPIRYALAAEEGGPISQVEYGQAEYMGQLWQLCRATLQEDFQHPMGKKLELFSSADGSGMGLTRLEARAKAISEALERWAYTETSSGPDAVLYGYPYSMSTKGMAAFPSVFPGMARRTAISEAFEYYSVDAWWGGTLNHWIINRDDSTIVFINQPEFKGHIALAIRHLDLNDYVAAYGIGSGATAEEAELKAQLEACRSQTILERRDATPHRVRNKPVLEMEQRLLEFSSREGFAMVKDRLASRPWLPEIKPNVIFDGPVKGPWNKYAHVWRYALEPFPIKYRQRQFVA